MYWKVLEVKLATAVTELKGEGLFSREPRARSVHTGVHSRYVYFKSCVQCFCLCLCVSACDEIAYCEYNGAHDTNGFTKRKGLFSLRT